MLQGTEHDGLAALGRDHDEDAFMADQLVEYQILEDLLAVLLAVTEVEVLKDIVVALLPAHAQGLLTAVSGIHIAHAQFAQHGTGRRAKVSEVVDDQKALCPYCSINTTCIGKMGGWREAMHTAETCIGSQPGKMRVENAADARHHEIMA